jgi:hypothetical protein
MASRDTSYLSYLHRIAQLIPPTIFSQQTRVCARILGIYRASAADLDSYQTQAHEQQGLCLNWWLLSGIEENQARNLYPQKKNTFFPIALLSFALSQ